MRKFKVVIEGRNLLLKMERLESEEERVAEPDRELSQLAARGGAEAGGVSFDAGGQAMCCGWGQTAVRGWCMDRGCVVLDQPQHVEQAGRVGHSTMARLATLLRLIPRGAGHSRGPDTGVPNRNGTRSQGAWERLLNAADDPPIFGAAEITEVESIDADAPLIGLIFYPENPDEDTEQVHDI